MVRASSESVRRERAVESYRTAAECIGALAPGCAIFGLTRGQFSLIDVILAVLDQTGPAAVTLWTWRIAAYEVDCVSRLVDDRRITSARLIIDAGSRERDMPLLRCWAERFGGDSVRIVRNHAKIAAVRSDRFRVLIRGSFNLNHNPRFEQFDLTEGGPEFDLVEQIAGDLPVLPLTCGAIEARDATKLGSAWTADQLAAFGGLQAWRA